ncbi:hypothetical protein CRE_18170 [Caenorhabditis remanei]|uniref:Uncharacterized protein n=1 Tax=Caenorhabditis remanei TaxID=31234 RepID=E3N8M5_CAERE|nr:hypothetical protein CRE_18170 [Caenorhabditis remanei]
MTRIPSLLFLISLIPLTNSCVRMIPPEEVSAGTTVASPPGEEPSETPTATPEVTTPGEEIPAGTCFTGLSNSIGGPWMNISPVDFEGNMNIVDVPNPTLKCHKVDMSTCKTWTITNWNQRPSM